MASSDGKHLTNEQTDQIRKLFASCDRDRKGVLNTNQIAQIVHSLGIHVEERDLKQVIRDHDLKGSGLLKLEQVIEVVASLTATRAGNLEDELRAAFRLYDKKGNGFIKVTELRSVLRSLDDEMSDRELNEMIAEIDGDGSGTIDFEEFLAMMTK